MNDDPPYDVLTDEPKKKRGKPKYLELDPKDLHPTDDTQEPGEVGTFGELNGACERYCQRRNAYAERAGELKVAQEAFEAAKQQLAQAATMLSERIKQANDKVVRSAGIRDPGTTVRTVREVDHVPYVPSQSGHLPGSDGGGWPRY